MSSRDKNHKTSLFARMGGELPASEERILSRGYATAYFTDDVRVFIFKLFMYMACDRDYDQIHILECSQLYMHHLSEVNVLIHN